MEKLAENESMRISTKPHGASEMYLWIVGVVFVALTVVFVFFPRSKYSELEKRDLTEFPKISDYSSRPGHYTAAVSTWFSDTEPYRDGFMTLSMSIRNALGAKFMPEDEAISIRPSVAVTVAEDVDDVAMNSLADLPIEDELTGENAESLDEGNAKLGDSGTIIVGKGDKVRALMMFGGSAKGGSGYVELLNTLAETFPDKQIYAMIAPLATEFYLPEKAKKSSNPQKPFIYSVRDRLSPKVKFVDVYDELSHHVNEDIYLRTDHHWSGLGGYYAAKRLAETAGVPFRGLDAYDRHVVKDFVGTMYGYSKDIAVKNAPEDFVYYTPTQVQYDAEYVAYTLNKNFQIVKESKPYKSSIFKQFRDGSGMAYLTFIGSDQVFVKVKTSTPGNRKLLIIKDSYGNAVPGNLLYSFNEIHIVDFRYFTHNLKDYIVKNGITDIAVCFNVFNAHNSSSTSKVKKMLTQRDGIFISPTATSKPMTDSIPSSEVKREEEATKTESLDQTEETSTTNLSEKSDHTNQSEESEKSESSVNSGSSDNPEE